MSIAKGAPNLSLDDILSRVSESQILARYLNVYNVPTVICSPLRKDEHPSFSISSPDGKAIFYKDFATGEVGSLFALLGKMWGKTFPQVLQTIANDEFHHVQHTTIYASTRTYEHSTVNAGNTKLEVKVREWTKEDIAYWESYGIPLELLKQAMVYPISHYFITKQDFCITFKADKYAYAFVESKEGNYTIKVYQPFNKGRHKWVSKHDRSVLGLWRLMPAVGEKVCICSSVKDALCLTANTNIPAICLQGEAYGISQTAQDVLRKRFENVFILLDNDEPGRRDAQKLQKETGFINIELPPFEGGKDVSDLYRSLGDPAQFKELILKLFNNDQN